MPQKGSVEAVVKEAVTSLGYELVDIQLGTAPGGERLVVMADRPGGLTLKDCEEIAKELIYRLEEEGWERNFRLEVSSPGLNRPLKKLCDFERFRGKKVAIETEQNLEGRRHFRGRLERVGGDSVYVTIDQVEFQIPFREIRKAHIVYEGED